jgi:hypothetical protein
MVRFLALEEKTQKTVSLWERIVFSLKRMQRKRISANHTAKERLSSLWIAAENIIYEKEMETNVFY